MSSIRSRYMVLSSVVGLLVLLLFPCESIGTEPWFDGPIVSDSPRRLLTARVGDLNHDGIGDIVAAATNVSRGYVFLGNALGQMALVDSFPMYIAALVIIDENADGHPDIIWSDDVGYYHVERNDGTGHFVRAGYHHVFGSVVTVVDLEGDGYEDLIGIWEYGAVIIYGSAAGLDWSNRQYLPMHVDMGGPGWGGFAVADLDGNGRLDIILVGEEDWELRPGALISWCLSVGPRQFEGFRTYYQGWAGDYFVGCSAGDLNRDGNANP